MAIFTIGAYLPMNRVRSAPAMFPSLPEPSAMPCPECGESVARAEREQHVCDEARLLEYRMFQLRGELEGLEDEIGSLLESPHGRFAAWLAENERRGGAGSAPAG